MFKAFAGQDQNAKRFADWGVGFITECSILTSLCADGFQGRLSFLRAFLRTLPV